ncbi:MAG TPA: cold shock domain-containing protein [Acidimicrobiales bacterium]|nr:cold shock domain-containing protein [Acidimicrobiales bacterium]
MNGSEGRGRVAEFDDHKGYGWIDDAGGQRLFFHCTAIADGSRTIEVGAGVTFDVVENRMGPEATNISGR